jgi:4-amino-4-deoxy-L-arabinose transferase-like glycosyltransferase
MRAREVGFLLPILVIYVAAMLAFPKHPDDEASYLTLAHRLLHGTYVTGDNAALLDANPASPDLWFGPGLPAVLVPLIAIDAPLEVVRLVGPLFLFGAMLLFFMLVRARAGPRAALLVTYALALYPPFWALLPNLHSEPPAIFCTVAAMLALCRYVQGGRLRWLALGGAALAVLALTRVAYGWVLALLLLLLLARLLVRRSTAIARSAAVTGAALVVCVPWLAYTHSVTGHLFVWGNSGPLSLYWMASPYPGDLGDWRRADQVFTDPKLAAHRTFFASLRGLPLAEQNVRIQDRAVENIVHHPARYGENLFRNASRMFLNFPYSDQPRRLKDLFYALPNVLVFAFLVFSAVVLIPRRRLLPAVALPIGLFGSIALVVHLAVSTYPRMLMPIVPIVAWFTVLALAQLGALDRGDNQVSGAAQVGTPALKASA